VPASVLLRLVAAVAALAVGAGAVTVAALLLSRTPGPVSSAAPATPSASSAPATPASVPKPPAGFPAPPAGATVFSREDGADTLALGVVPLGSSLLAQASVLGDQGQGVRGLEVQFSVQGATKTGMPCGPGCYRAALTLTGAPAEVDVDVHGGSAATRWRVAMPAPWPPADGSALMARAGKAWRALRSLSYEEHLASDATHEVTSSWRIVAPDRIAYRVAGGDDSVIIGGRRWDKAPGGTWVESPQLPVTQPVPFWVSVTDAHVLGTRALDGRRVSVVSFFDPGTPAWFEAEVDVTTARTLSLRMMTTAHFMHDVYGSFDAATSITAPK
jgi:hypothetical protein